MINKTIAIFGSPGCGKTTNAVKLALALAKNHKQNVILVSLERALPAIPYLISNFQEQEISLGHLLTYETTITHKEITEACMEVPKERKVAVLGYQFGDYHNTYPELAMKKIEEFFIQLRSKIPFAIIDCSSLLKEDLISSYALGISDVILRFSSANLKGLIYFNSLDKELTNKMPFLKEKELTLISNCRAGQNWQRVAAGYGKIFDVLPHCPELAAQFDEMCLWDDLTTKEGLSYMKGINKLAYHLAGNASATEIIKEIKEERKAEIKAEQKAEKKEKRKSFFMSIIKNGVKAGNKEKPKKSSPAQKPKTGKKPRVVNGEW